MKLTGESLQSLVLTHIPEMPSLVNEFGRVVVETELPELLVCEGSIERLSVNRHCPVMEAR